MSENTTLVEEAGEIAKEVVIENEDVLKSTLAEALRGIIDNVSAAKNFLVEETPEVIQQLLLWKGIEAFIAGCFGVFILYSIYRGIKRHWDFHVKWTKESEGGYLVLLAIVVLFLGGFGFSYVLDFMTAIQIAVAPKIYLIEYAAQLLR